MKTYESNNEGKAKYVKECLEPAYIGVDEGWESLTFIPNYQDRQGYDVVLAVNKNSDKTIAVNVSCDSVRALFWDVAKTIGHVLERF